MDDVKQGLTTYINLILRTDTTHHRQTIEKYFREDAVLNNPAFQIKGTQNIIKLFKAWSRWNSTMGNTIHDIYYDRDANKAVVSMTEHVRPKLLPIQFSMHLVITFRLADTDRGKVIVQQDDYISVQGVLRCTTFGRMLYDNVLLPACTGLTQLGMNILGQESSATPKKKE